MGTSYRHGFFDAVRVSVVGRGGVFCILDRERAASFDQQLHQRKMSPSRREMQRSVACTILQIDIRTQIQQLPCHIVTIPVFSRSRGRSAANPDSDAVTSLFTAILMPRHPTREVAKHPAD